MRALANGEMTALEQLYRRHGDLVHGYLLRQAGDPAKAEDLTHDTFLKALHGAHLYEGRGSARGWLLKIARHLLLDAWRRRPPAQAGTAEVAEPSELAARAERTRAVRAEVDRLPPELREALLLRVVDELSYKEIQEVTGVPERTLRHRLGRAIATLRAGLEGRG